MGKSILEMDDKNTTGDSPAPAAPPSAADNNEVDKLRAEFESRLVKANLRAEAIRAGMIDLDGLKLIDTSGVKLGNDDTIVDGQNLMTQLRRNKPWLFGSPSSSSTSQAPNSQPVRQKTAMEMSDEEYAAARSAITRQPF
jgi:hypothetical protein